MPLEGLRVLPAEDCPDQGRLYLTFVQSGGARASLEYEGRSAVNVVRHSSTLYDVVVMDFQMPALDGLDATRQLRELGHKGVIVAVTAFASWELKESWFRAGRDEFLETPLGRNPFVSAIFRQTTTESETSEMLQRNA